MKLSVLIIIFLFSSIVYSQHTHRFLALTKVLKKKESKTDTIFHSNGQPYYIYVRSTYEYDDGKIARNYTGTSYVYSRNGDLSRVTIQDDFGNFINDKFFDRKGKLTKERITTEIDNRAESIEDYLNSKKYGDFKNEINYYKYSRKTKRRYKYKEEFLTLKKSNVIKIRNFLDENGIIIRTKTLNYKE